MSKAAATTALATGAADGSEFCTLAKKQFDDLPNTMSGILSASPAEQSKIIDAITAESNAIVAKAPSALKADLVLSNEASGIARQMLANPGDETQLAKLTELIERPDFKAAGKRLAEYFRTNCGFDPESITAG